jgi:hypothetical protein
METHPWGTPGAWTSGQQGAPAVCHGHLGPAIWLGKCSLPAVPSGLVFSDKEAVSELPSDASLAGLGPRWIRGATEQPLVPAPSAQIRGADFAPPSLACSASPALGGGHVVRGGGGQVRFFSRRAVAPGWPGVETGAQDGRLGGGTDQARRHRNTRRGVLAEAEALSRS